MKIYHAMAALAAIILVQAGLASTFSWHAAEVFSGTAVGALFFYALFKLSARKKAEK